MAETPHRNWLFVVTGPKTTTVWRYQPVYSDDAAGRYFSLCQVHLDGEDRLVRWSDELRHGQGEGVEELGRDLMFMWVASFRYQPVRFADLKPGMKFVANFDQTMANQLAAMMESVTS